MQKQNNQNSKKETEAGSDIDISTIVREFFYKLRYTQSSEELEAEQSWEDIINRIHSCFKSLASPEESDVYLYSKQNLALLYQELHEELAKYVTLHYSAKFYTQNRKELEYQWDNYIQKIIANQVSEIDKNNEITINTPEAAKENFGPAHFEETLLDKINKKDSEFLMTIENQQGFVYELLHKIHNDEALPKEELDKAPAILEDWVELGVSKLYSSKTKDYRGLRSRLAEELLEMLDTNFKDYLLTRETREMPETTTKATIKTAFGEPENYLTKKNRNSNNKPSPGNNVKASNTNNKNIRDKTKAGASQNTDTKKTEEEANLETEYKQTHRASSKINLWQKLKDMFN